jgi:hypothetical protein
MMTELSIGRVGWEPSRLNHYTYYHIDSTLIIDSVDVWNDQWQQFSHDMDRRL